MILALGYLVAYALLLDIVGYLVVTVLWFGSTVDWEDDLG